MIENATNNHWLLPQGIEEALPEDAARLESLRRELLDKYAAWGYQLVMPPMIEFLDSLLTGTGHDLSLHTFKTIDQLTGRTLGLRADMTPQVARIDARQNKQSPNRLCYLGTVLHTLPDGFGSSRSLLQAGAELYGHDGVESDVEILCLMLETLQAAGIADVYLDIGHVGIYRGLARQAGFNAEQEARLFEMLQRKAIPEIQAFLASMQLKADIEQMLLQLPELHGDKACLSKATEVFAAADESVKEALRYLQQVVEQLRLRVSGLEIHFDLSELRGYHYHTGILFAAYTPGEGQEIARGGRYDDIGQVFGRARPATGFSTDIKTLIKLSSQHAYETGITSAILAPSEADEALWQKIKELRMQGETVIQALVGQQGDAKDLGCDRVLTRSSGQWQVQSAG